MGDKFVMTCAIDLGTTYSGYAFVHKHSSTDVYGNIPESGLNSSKFTKTCVLTGPNGKCEAIGYDAVKIYDLYKKQGKTGYNLFQNFKMNLYGTSETYESIYVVSENGTKRPALEIFAIMIKKLKEHCLKFVEETLRLHVHAREIKWVLTIPAIWNDNAKLFMRQAALKAGLIKEIDSKKLILALESEAAALHCVQAQDVKLKEGEKFLVIDAGGGTIDITAYQILEDMKLKEVIASNGGDWGCTAVDREYEIFLRFIFGCGPHISVIMKQFELDKRRITNSGADKIAIPKENLLKINYDDTEVNKMLENNGIQLSKYMLKINNPERFFKKTIDKIKAHIIQQLQNPKLHGLSYIILVGGFGESPILHEAINDIKPSDCQLITHPEASLCVLKGAVYFGLYDSKITCRIVKKTYGVAVEEKFIHGKHLEKYKDKDDTIKIFHPLIIKGQNVNYDDIIETVYNPIFFFQSELCLELYSSDIVDFKPVMYAKEKGLSKLGEMTLVVPRAWNLFHRDRSVYVKYKFGGTEVNVTATNTYGHKVDTRVNYSSESYTKLTKCNNKCQR